ncbi:hypothetical protein [Flavisolibacter tropicus]|uniref:Uncharacterized protein n=1 Tax=Flavisolibacter tropicus TaxID=1492898 RepID=A0A172TQG3_9BACT|nr:hypothetical protein [Flavisolibacter tropicus]ANE49270.1 hypothetical protein SY85_00880 [Flavisolibacter tropicus]
MDSRETLPVNATFMKHLAEAYQAGSKVHLLVDDEGLVRAEGFIKTIITDTANSIVELEGGMKIEVRKIVAVNGLFLPEYGEC